MIEIPGTAPISEDDAFLEAALLQASIPTLLLAMVHVTGDPSWIRGPIRPQVPIAGEMQGYLGEEVPAEYVPMMIEELALEGDTRKIDRSRVPAAAKRRIPVLVIGAGMSGLLMAIRRAEPAGAAEDRQT